MSATQSVPLVFPRTSMPDMGVQHMFPTAQSVNPAEVAQARVFEKVLHAEFVELNRIATTMAARPTASEQSGSRQPAQLSRIHARIGEVHGLLEALRDRFPHVRLASELPSASA